MTPYRQAVRVVANAKFDVPLERGIEAAKKVAERKLAQMDAAPSLMFMKAPPGNDLKEYPRSWHVRINDQWRLTFKWGLTGLF
jgi:proteic killer suppression protein